MKKKFYSNGKLLLTGEYTVLDGAKALALPTKFGQDLVVEETGGQFIHWKSFDSDGSIWFEERLSFEEIDRPKTDLNETKNTLIKILHEASLLNPTAFKAKTFSIQTHLTFPRSWGLGTSSTLINNISQWLGVDAYTLLQNSFGGSGYDIACAQYNRPLVYQLRKGKPAVEEVSFDPVFTSHLYFVYLNKKQSSKEAIASYRKSVTDKTEIIAKISRITEEIVNTKDARSFTGLLEDHENLMSEILGLEKAKALFPDFNGTIKSLGAWGGDFILAVSDTNPEAYFLEKGYETIIPYAKMIL